MSCPASDLDLAAPPGGDPYPAYAALRQLGPAVYLTRYDVWALARHDAATRVLTDPETFQHDTTGRSAPAHELATATPTFLASRSDPRRARETTATPRVLRPLVCWTRKRAGELVGQAGAKGAIDAVRDLAEPLIGDLVMRLTGLPPGDRDYVLRLVDRAVDTAGPADHTLSRQASPAADTLLDYLTRAGLRTREHGTCPAPSGPGMPHGCPSPARDTVRMLIAARATTHACTTLLHLLATHPRQWHQVRQHHTPGTAACALREALRYDPPVAQITRVATRTTRVGDTLIPRGARLVVLCGSAGRDPRYWGPTADEFTIGRSGTHLAFGNDPHQCPGRHLVHRVLSALLTALAHACPRLTPAATPARRPSATLRGWTVLPLTLHTT